MNTRIRFFIALGLILILIGLGITGYSVIEGWGLTDSLYMTFITLTTVGFGEVRPLSETGRYFTIVFIIIGIGTAGFAITTLFGFIFEGAMVRAMKERRMELFRRRMRGHYIICGYGDVGREVASELKKHSVHFVVVDRNPAQAEQFQDKSAVLIVGDATEEAVLERAKIGEADGLVAALADDAATLFVVLTARQMNSKLQIVAKATDENAARKMRKAGADRVVT
ncbi:MAG: potassium channel protein, partial [Spirochaetales bacterium]